jgi:iron-sulfur cluster repair protein YtfE (RIC family)
MYPYAIINFHELTPSALCDVIANKFHLPLTQTAEQVMAYFNLERQEDHSAPAAADLQQLLFGKMQTEVSQLIRKEATILFPVIRNISTHNTGKKNIQPAAAESVQQSFQKILLLLQKLRQVSGNYQLQHNWSSAYKICVSDMFVMEQILQQWIYIEQNILYPAVMPGHTIVVTQHDINNIIID